MTQEATKRGSASDPTASSFDNGHMRRGQRLTARTAWAHTWNRSKPFSRRLLKLTTFAFLTTEYISLRFSAHFPRSNAPCAQFRSADVGVETSGNADVGHNSLSYRRPSTVVHIGERPSVQVAVSICIPVPSANKVLWVAVQTKLPSPQSTVSSTTSLPRPRRSCSSVTASSSGLLRMKHHSFFVADAVSPCR